MHLQDENRQFDDAAVDVKHMADLVRRDRNHASVIIWSTHLVAASFHLATVVTVFADHIVCIASSN